MSNEKVELRVTNIRMSETEAGTYDLTMHTCEGDHGFTAHIGTAEGRAIMLELKSIHTTRPMTHDLFAALLGALEVKILRVLIYRVENNVFYAFIFLRQGNRVLRADARTSDAVILAMKTGAPIYTYKDLVTSIESGDSSYYDADAIKADETEEHDKGMMLLGDKYVEILEKQLQDAVQREDYESAAKLRDMINSMRKKD